MGLLSLSKKTTGLYLHILSKSLSTIHTIRRYILVVWADKEIK
jgi:hypothetical protein